MNIRRCLKLLSNINARWPLLIVGYLLVLIIIGITLINPLLFAYLIDHILLRGEIQYLTPLLLIGFIIALVGCVFSIMKDWLFRYLDICYTLDLRDAALKHLRKMPIFEIEKTGPAKFQNLLGLDTAISSNFITRILVDWFSNVAILFISLGIVLCMDWKLGLLTVLSVLLLMFFPRCFKKPILKYSREVREHNEETANYLFECMEGSKDIRILGLEDWEHKRNQVMYKSIVKVSALETFYKALTTNISGFIISIIIIAIYWMGNYMTQNAVISVGLLVAVITYLNNSLFRVQSINGFYGELQNLTLAMQRLEDFMNSPVEDYFRKKNEPKLNYHIPVVESTVDTVPKKEDLKVIEISQLNVTVGKNKIIKDISLSIAKNQKIAFIGLSGSGKTSFYKALLGFIPIESGEIFLFGENITQISRERLNSMIGMVFQESFIFKGTIFENIAIGKLDASFEEVQQAAWNANLKPLLDKLPQGIYTEISNKGLNFSGGERQRIAIARSFLRKPEILILDEPTSALDRLSEHYVIDALDKLMQNKTTLISTHRLDTIINADLIVVLDNGRIVESGTHHQLMSKSSFYYSLMTHYGQDDVGYQAVP